MRLGQDPARKVCCQSLADIDGLVAGKLCRPVGERAHRRRDKAVVEKGRHESEKVGRSTIQLTVDRPSSISFYAILTVVDALLESFLISAAAS